MFNFLKSKFKAPLPAITEDELNRSIMFTSSKKQYVYVGYGKDVADDVPSRMIWNAMRHALHDGTMEDAYVEFIPLFEIPHRRSFLWWLENEGPNVPLTTENAGKLFFDYVLRTRYPWTQENMNNYWETAPMNECIHSFMLPLYNSSIAIDFIDKEKTFEFKMSNEFVTALTKTLEDKYGAGNVYVSNQVIPAHTMLTHWGEFAKQESECLKGGYRYHKGMWDTQTFEADSLMVPFFGVPVGIKTRIPRIVQLADVSDTLLSMTNHYFDVPDYLKIIEGCVPEMCAGNKGPMLLDIEHAHERLLGLMSIYFDALKKQSPSAFNYICRKVESRYGVSGERGETDWLKIFPRQASAI